MMRVVPATEYNDKEGGQLKMFKTKSQLFSALIMATAAVLFSTPVLANKSCKKYLAPKADKSASDRGLELYLTERPFEDILLSDPKKNLVTQHPFMAMNTAQRFYAMILAGGVEEREIFLTGKYPVYNLFSTPSKANDYNAIIGHEDKIHKGVVSYIRNSIDGFVKPPLLQGPHGTGKSLLIDIFKDASTYYSSHRPDFYFWTYEFVNLDKITSEPAFEMISNGRKMAPMRRSPLVLLPKSYQDMLLEFAKESVAALGVGSPKRPPAMDNKTERIRSAIIKHYLAEAGKTSFTDAEIVDILKKHVVLRRTALDGLLIDSQDKNFDLTSIFGTRDPMMWMDLGLEDPLSWTYGTIAKAEGGLLYLDEFYRNPSTLRDKFLRPLGKRGEVDMGGPDPLEVDMLVIMASNSASVQDVLKDPKGQAHLNRVVPFMFLWDTRPHNIVKILLLEYGQKFQANKLPLNSDSAPGPSELTRATLDDLFPPLIAKKPLLGTDGRYQLVGKDGAPFINPHTLMYMASVTAATRLHVDPKEALQQRESAGKVVQTDEFRNPITRVKILSGELEVRSPALLKELTDMSELLHDGEIGISARAFGTWFEAIMAKAGLPGQHNSMTPRLAMEVLQELLRSGAGDFSVGPELRAQWLGLASEVMREITIPKLNKDILTSMHESDDLGSTYIEISHELIAIGEDGTATQYMHPVSGEMEMINQSRLDEIKKIYSKISGGEVLSPKHLARFTHERVISGASEVEARNPTLMNSIVKYYADLDLRRFTLAQLLGASRGRAVEREVQDKYKEMWNNMTNKLGYDEVGLRDAMQIVRRYEDLEMLQKKKTQ